VAEIPNEVLAPRAERQPEQVARLAVIEWPTEFGSAPFLFRPGTLAIFGGRSGSPELEQLRQLARQPHSAGLLRDYVRQLVSKISESSPETRPSREPSTQADLTYGGRKIATCVAYRTSVTLQTRRYPGQRPCAKAFSLVMRSTPSCSQDMETVLLICGPGRSEMEDAADRLVPHPVASDLGAPVADMLSAALSYIRAQRT
jgi:hypothetical protein